MFLSQYIDLMSNSIVDVTAKYSRSVCVACIQTALIVGPLAVFASTSKALGKFLKKVREGLRLVAVAEALVTPTPKPQVPVHALMLQQFVVDDKVVVVESPTGKKRINNNDVGQEGTVLKRNGAWIKITITNGEFAGTERSFKRSNLNLV